MSQRANSRAALAASRPRIDSGRGPALIKTQFRPQYKFRVGAVAITFCAICWLIGLSVGFAIFRR